ncbi:MAG: sulfate ABC transporter permease subunit CysT [Candidatus Schekmanbacteria bacterium]|nr:sulfate ABC transporter permease subunit CysT [Candidatus Schekmanbacteria bacterium]
MRRIKQYSILPGFGLTLGITLVYTSTLVLLPLAGLFAKSAELGWRDLWQHLAAPRALAAYGLSLGASFAAALIDAFFGLVVAWVLVRYRFFGRRLLDALVDLPFALPTAVSGIALTTLFSEHGWLGMWLAPLGVRVAFTRLGIVVALMFIGIPFVVRTLQPALLELPVALEEAAATLGAGRWQIFRRVILPTLWPSLLTGFAMAFARALGEYGSVVFIAGNMPMRTEIVPLLIMIELEQYDYAGATVLGATMLLLSFALLLAINRLQRWGGRRAGAAT